MPIVMNALFSLIVMVTCIISSVSIMKVERCQLLRPLTSRWLRPISYNLGLQYGETWPCYKRNRSHWYIYKWASNDFVFIITIIHFSARCPFGIYMLKENIYFFQNLNWITNEKANSDLSFKNLIGQFVSCLLC
jgi:hypothetical protein